MARGFNTLGTGTTDRIRSTSPTMGQVHSFAYRVKWASSTGNALMWRDSDAGRIWLTFVDTGVWYLRVGDGGAEGSWYKDISALVDTTNWHDVVVTYDGSGNGNVPKLYVDGSEVTSLTEATAGTTLGLGTGTKTLYVGNDAIGSSAIDGALSGVAVWDAILSGANVTAYHGGDAPSTIAAANLIVDLTLKVDATTDGEGNTWATDGNPLDYTDPYTYGGGGGNQSARVLVKR